MESYGFLIVALAILSYGLVSGRMERSAVTPPMAFALFGFLIGPRVLGWASFDFEAESIHILAELTLVLVLFTDASRIDLRALWRDHDLPVRMLAIGLPLTVVLGTVAAVLLFGDLGIWQAAVLAAILAPTDAAVGQAVVSNPRLPVRVRQTLNVESGLNDGIMVPVLLILISCAEAVEQASPAGYWIRFTLLQVTVGPAIGVAVGYIGGKMVTASTRTGWMNDSFQRLSAIGLALAAYSIASVAGGNGFIAAFCAGLALGNSARHVCGRLYEFSEAEGQLLTLLVFMVFGVAMLPVAIDGVSWETVLYALLSLTAIRLIPVALSLVGSGLKSSTVLFLGWFGPRGIASILFALVVLQRSLPAQHEILEIVVTTVALSVLLHGLTAYPASVLYARRLAAGGAGMQEHEPVSEMPLRIRSS